MSKKKIMLKYIINDIECCSEESDKEESDEENSDEERILIDPSRKFFRC